MNRPVRGLRLLLISNMYPSKKDPGYGIFIRNIEEGLVKNGVRLTRIAIAGRGKNLLHKLGKYLFFYLRILTIPLREFDVVQVGYPSHSYAPLMFRRLEKILLTVRLHGLDLVEDRREEKCWIRAARIFTRLAINRADLVVVPSRYFAGELIKRHRPAAIHIYPSGGVNREIFYPAVQAHPSPTLGYVGRLDRLKGVDLTLQALALLNIQCEFIIAGQGPFKRNLTKLCSRLGLEKQVRFIGWHPPHRLREVYNRMDILVFPTLRKAESFGNVALEAMACGVPVVGSRMAGVTEYLEEGINGFYFNPGDRFHLARVLERFYSLSIPERRNLRQGALATAARFEQQKVSAGYVRHLIRLLKSPDLNPLPGDPVTTPSLAVLPQPKETTDRGDPADHPPE